MKSFPRVASRILFIVLTSAIGVYAQGEKEQLADSQPTASRSAASESTSLVESTPVQTSDDDSPYILKKRTRELGVWGGGAFTATTAFGGITEAEAEGRKLLLTGLRYGRVFATTKSVAFEYTFDVIPAAVAFNNIVARPGTIPGTTAFVRDDTYGAGLSPVGLKVLFGRGRVKPFTSIGAGFLVFQDSVPLPDAGKFAWVLEGDGGLQVFTEEKRAIIFGVKLHHISNGDRAGSNRGLNQFVFYVGYSFFK
jgi:hypothetical protein